MASFFAFPVFGQASFTGQLGANYDIWNRMTTINVSSGQICHYEVTPIQVPAGGTYVFTLTTTNFGGAINLYEGEFISTTPAENFWDTGAVSGSSGTLQYTNYLSQGSFNVVVSSAYSGQTGTYGMVISGPGTVTVLPRPTTPAVLSEPLNATILTNNSAQLIFSAEGAYPRSYQWYEGVSGVTTNPVANATNNPFTTQVFTNTGDHYFWARLTNSYGSVDTVSALVRVVDGPNHFSGNLRVGNATFYAGYYKLFAFQIGTIGTYRFNVGCTNFTGYVELRQGAPGGSLYNSGSGPFITFNTYIAVQDTFYLVITTTTAGQTGTYSGNITGPALVTELPAPQFVQQPMPTNQMCWPDSPGAISVVSSIPDTMYEWYPGVSPGVPADGLAKIQDATNSVFTPSPAPTNRWFWCRVWNGYGYDDSDVVAVQSRPPPVFSSYPGNPNLFYGAPSPTLSVTASNIPFWLGWFAGSSPDTTTLLTNLVVQGISSNYQSSAQLTFTPPFLNAGSYTYWVRATNPAGTTNGSTITISVQKQLLTVTADPQTRFYGDTNPPLTFSYSGFVHGDTPALLTFAPVPFCFADTNSPIGQYPIGFVTGSSSNYNFFYNSAPLTVQPAPLTLIGSNVSRPYGAPNPPLSGTIVGLKNSDPITATWSTTATAASPPGNYPITPTLSDPSSKLTNYNVITNTGVLTIVPFISLVTNTNDSGAGSLRAAVQNANPYDQVAFASNVVGTIHLTTGPVLIDKPLSIAGPGPAVLTVQGDGVDPTFDIAAPGVLVSRLTVSGGMGGGFRNRDIGTLTVVDCNVANNFQGFVNDGLLVISNSALFSNYANLVGAGLYNGVGQATIINSTIALNSLPAGYTVTGAGIYNFHGSLTVQNSTIAYNDASSTGRGGGIYAESNTTNYLFSTLIAANTAANAPDISGPFTSQGFNLIGIGDGSTGITNGVNNDQSGMMGFPLGAMLGPLGNTGGWTLTIPLEFGSPAIDRGMASTLLDQRDQARIYDFTSLPNAADGTDVGAYELSPGTLLVTRSNATINLSWSIEPQGMVLEAATNLNAPAAWSAVTNVPTPINGSNTVSVSATNGRKFFRLHKL